MKNPLIKILLSIYIILLYSCANEGYPPGGPEDETPPIPQKSNPAPNSLNFRGKEVKIQFDENVVLKDLLNNFIISPPLEEQPIAKAYAKEVRVDLNNELQENTTYTIYFGNSIVDNNAGNVLPDFSFAFSTGDEIDSMVVSGTVLDAYNLDPISDILLGLYANHEDSAFIKNVPLRIAKTDSEGRFAIRNVPYGKYKVYALKDANNDYRFNQPGEKIAFIESIVEPYLDTVIIADTLFTDSATVDTIIHKPIIWYYPDSLMFLAFSKDRVFQNLKKKERSSAHKFTFFFSSALDSMPKLELIDTTIVGKWNIPERSVTGDTLYYWLTDSMLYKNDSIKVEFTYQKTDTLNQLVWQTDTFELNYRKKATKKKRKPKKDKEGVKPPNPKLNYSENINTSMGYGAPVFIEFDEPIKQYDINKIRLLQKIDTLVLPIKFTLEQDTQFFRRYYIRKKWNPEITYRIEWDSTAFENIYDIVSDKYESDFKVKDLDQYSEIFITIENAEESGFMHLLNTKDEIVKTLPFNHKKPEVKFKLLTPGTYFAKLEIDTNNNGEWDTGDFLLHQQPEPVYYFHKRMEVKANWTFEEIWNIQEKPIYKQKPEDIKGIEKK